jgi:branched-chain amino acid transport system ATP-binding protein
MSAQSAALQVSGIHKHFGGVQALRCVSFEVAAGEILGLIGANGAGKTTLLDIIGGEQTSDQGTILLHGTRLTGPPHRRSRAGLARTFQHPRINLDLTIFENVAVGLAVREMASTWKAIALPLRAMLTGQTPARHLVEQACGEVGLTEIDRPSRSLSFGEMRLLEVARAVIQKPAIILLDEPFPGLDDEGATMLVQALRRLAASGQAIVIVDHNVVIVEALVQRVVLLARGEVVFVGPTQACVRSQAFRQEYVGSA